jgi:chromosome segregation ATPase
VKKYTSLASLLYVSRIADYKNHIEELKNIKVSVNNELRELENKRNTLQTEIAGYTTHIDTLKTQYSALKKELSQVGRFPLNVRLICA